MKLIEFPQQTIVIAKDQPEYQPLPAHVFENDPQGRIAFCWKLTLKERLQLLFTGRLWHQVLTFRKPLQPQMMSVQMPEMKGGFKFLGWTCLRLCLTRMQQAGGAPFVDKCTTQDIEGRCYRGFALLLKPWKRNKYGESLPQPAFVIAWRQKEEEPGLPIPPDMHTSETIAP